MSYLSEKDISKESSAVYTKSAQLLTQIFGNERDKNLDTSEILDKFSYEDEKTRRELWKLPEDQRKREDYYFFYIPSSLRWFIESILFLKKVVPQYKKFIDVGCGIGDKVLVAQQFLDFETSAGVEYSELTFRTAKKLESVSDKIKIYLGDAFEFSFSSFNFVYLYVPIRSDRLMCELFFHVMETMEEGIYFDIAHGGYLRIIEKLGIEPKFRYFGFIKKDNKIDFLYKKLNDGTEILF